MTLDENQLHDLIHSCYEAAFEPTRWQAIRKRLRAALGAEEYRKLVHHLPDGDPGPAGSDGGTDPAPPTVRRDGCAADSTGGGLLARLLPHIDRSRQIHLRLTTANRRTARLAAALDRLPLAVLLVATDDRVVYANAAGARLLRAGDGLALRDGRVVAAGRPETDRLHRLIAAAAGARHIASSGRMIALPRPAPGQPRVVLVAPLPSGAVNGATTATTVLLLVREPAGAAPIAGAHLVELFGLTGAEARVATALPGADSLREVAERLGISLATLRTHLHRLYDKTGTRRPGGAGLAAGDPGSTLS